MKRKGMWLAVFLILAILAGYYGKEAERRQKQQTEESKEQAVKSKEPDRAETFAAEEGELLREYYALLLTTQEEEEVYRFLEEHISECEPKDADQLLNGLIGYKTSARLVDYNRLTKQQEYFSEEMQQFLELMQTEQNRPSIGDGGLKLPLALVLFRVEKLEEFAVTYPEGVGYPYIYELYEELLEAAVTGFYDGEDKRSCIFLDAEEDRIKESAVESYLDFIRIYPKSNTAAVLQKYISLLKEDDRRMNRKVTTFYGRAASVIKENFKIGEAVETGWNNTQK